MPPVRRGLNIEYPMNQEFIDGQIEAMSDGFMKLLDLGFEHPDSSTLDLFTKLLYRKINDTIPDQSSRYNKDSSARTDMPVESQDITLFLLVSMTSADCMIFPFSLRICKTLPEKRPKSVLILTVVILP